MSDCNPADDYATGDHPDATLDATVDAVRKWQDRHDEYHLYADVTPNRYGEIEITFRDMDTDQLVREVIGLDEFEEYTHHLEVMHAYAPPLQRAA